jgi:hypothetical protein
MPTDKERIDWLQKVGNGIALINDDAGHWAVAIEGSQNVVRDGPVDVYTAYYIEAYRFKSTVRKAIDWAMKHWDEREDL